MAAIQATKAKIRSEIAGKIRLLTAEEKRAQSEEVSKKLFKLPAFKKSRRISVYLSTKDEICTETVIRKIFDDGKLCYVPRYNKNVMEMVRLYSMKDWEELPLTKWSIKQPKLSENRENALEAGGLDCIIVPGVAFTKNGIRLGHGKGYYDSFLSNLIETQEDALTTVALAFNEQILEDIPAHEHDVDIDMVICSD